MNNQLNNQDEKNQQLDISSNNISRTILFSNLFTEIDEFKSLINSEVSNSSNLPSFSSIPIPSFNPQIIFSFFPDNFESKNEYFDSESKQLAEMEIKTWCKSKEISYELLSESLRLWNKSLTGEFPTLDIIIDNFSTKLCSHALFVPLDFRKEIVRYFLCNFGRMPNCLETEAIINYRIIHKGNFPSEEELETTIKRTLEFDINPEEFHQKDKNYIPVANIELIKTEVLDSKETVGCALCFDQINNGSKYIKLNPCGHYFHAISKDCLDDKCIIDWMKTHKTCPVCRCEIKILDN